MEKATQGEEPPKPSTKKRRKWKVSYETRPKSGLKMLKRTMGLKRPVQGSSMEKATLGMVAHSGMPENPRQSPDDCPKESKLDENERKEAQETPEPSTTSCDNPSSQPLQIEATELPLCDEAGEISLPRAVQSTSDVDLSQKPSSTLKVMIKIK
ncbi:uncharacterized protein LOC143670566 [Tamandua tetradactyla]|uniref:uncharacterized protein LOC143670566 n=1 Tax=Tamandua tetradactyla TaxID=48850 RepID=UPI004053F27A